MNLKEISLEIREILDNRRKEIDLTFIEESHMYYMRDLDGIIKNTFPSVSKVYGKFHEHFDADTKAFQMARGDEYEQQLLLEKWKNAADYSTNMGSRVHYELEKYHIEKNGSYKEVRQPIFQIDDEQREKSDNMIVAGKNFLNLMEARGAVLLDTETVLGDPELKYVGQPDKSWLILNKNKDDVGIIITDYKSNKPKNFEIQPWTKKLYEPFSTYDDTALGHYYLQLPLYGRLLLKMLKGTKYENIKLLGCVVVLLRDDSTYTEYRVPQPIINTILSMDIKKYLN